MEIIRGGLEDISPPGSRERAGSRASSVPSPFADRSCPAAAFSLVVLTKDTADLQIQSSSEESVNSSSERDYCHIGTTEEEKEDSKLQKAVKEMRRLDEILSAEISKEKEIKRQRKERQAKLWEDLLHNKPEGHSECSHEALNTRLFLALEAATGTEEQGSYVPVFETQVPDCDQDGQRVDKSEKRPSTSTESFDVGFVEAAGEQSESSHCGSSKSKKKQDFVKRNIELVSGEKGQVLLTQPEKDRLAKLLREIDKEEEQESVTEGDNEDMWAVSVQTGQAYTPEPSDLEQLIKLESKLRRLLPAEEFLSVQNSYTHFSMSKGRGSNVAWNDNGDAQPGEKALWEIKERRVQERRLREIQQQLEMLGRGQEMTDASPDLTEEQLLSLLDECKLMESWSQDVEMNDTTP